MQKSTWMLFVAILLSLTAAYPDEYGQIHKEQIADGVYLFSTTPYGDVGMCGNSVAILSNEGVLVFDSGAVPQTAAAVVAEIRKLTDRPVLYLVNSHWHWDHWGGNQVYRSEFPKIQIIAHEKTLEQMKEVEPRWNDEGVKVHLPKYIESLETKLAGMKAKPEDTAELETLIAADRSFLEQKRTQRKTYPDTTFAETRVIRMGERKIEVRHARGITAGDAYLYLPKERILITGDLLLNPYPFAIGGTFPSDWVKALEIFQSLSPAFVIPGHGNAVQGQELIRNTLALFRETIRLVSELHKQGLPVEKSIEEISKRADTLAALVGVRETDRIREFRGYFLNVFSSRAYREMDQPLGDLPDGIE